MNCNKNDIKEAVKTVVEGLIDFHIEMIKTPLKTEISSLGNTFGVIPYIDGNFNVKIIHNGAEIEFALKLCPAKKCSHEANGQQR